MSLDGTTEVSLLITCDPLKLTQGVLRKKTQGILRKNGLMREREDELDGERGWV